MSHIDLKEVRLPILDQFGTVDRLLIKEPQAHLIDYKTGFLGVTDAEINAQMQAYTLGVWDKWASVETVMVHLLLPRRDEISYATFSRERDYARIRLRIETIIARAREKAEFCPSLKACQYCGNKGRCQALAEKALQIASDIAPGLPLPKDVTGLTASPEDLSKILKVVPIIEEWADSIKKLALDKALNEGVELPGFRLTERKTPRSITSALLAYEAVKDTVDIKDFLAACSKVSVPDLEKFFAEGLPRGKKAVGKQELVDRLTDAGVLKQDGIIHVLKAEKP